MDYTCIICFELCRYPISCNQCRKLICRQHTARIQNKCPHCRLEPFEFNAQPGIEKIIELQRFREKQQMKKYDTFKCLVDGCTFKGKYSQMLHHRKGKHFNQTIDEMIFPEDRKNKIKREALKMIFFNKFQVRNSIYRQIARKIYVQHKGKCQFDILVKMLAHIDLCKSPSCRKIQFEKENVFIGDLGGNHSICPRAKHLQTKI